MKNGAFVTPQPQRSRQWHSCSRVASQLWRAPFAARVRATPAAGAAAPGRAREVTNPPGAAGSLLGAPSQPGLRVAPAAPARAAEAAGVAVSPGDADGNAGWGRWEHRQAPKLSGVSPVTICAAQPLVVVQVLPDWKPGPRQPGGNLRPIFPLAAPETPAKASLLPLRCCPERGSQCQGCARPAAAAPAAVPAQDLLQQQRWGRG